MKKSTLMLCHGATIGAVYALLTVATWSFSSMQIQIRLSESLCILPLFTPAAIPGLFVGCLTANLIGGNVIDAVFGSIATLLAALITRLIGKTLKNKRTALPLSLLPPILINAIAVPLILYFGYGYKDFMGFESALPVLLLNALSVLIGQTISCLLLGSMLFRSLEKINKRFSLFKY